MKIYGTGQKKDSSMSGLDGITILAEPSSLRDLAAFLYRCADAIEDDGSEWEQDAFDSEEHFCPQIIVFNPALIDD